MARGLNLAMELASPLLMPALMRAIAAAKPDIDHALKSLNFVHFARFLPTQDNRHLLVITEFDGELEPYVMDFAATIGDAFTTILSFMKDPPPLPVQRHPAEFWDYIRRCNEVRIGGVAVPGGDSVFSAYPQRTVLDIVGVKNQPLALADDALEVPIDFHDVQGNVLYPYGADLARHHALTVVDPVQARAFLAKLIDARDGLPRLTDGRKPRRKEPRRVMVNVGLTAEGLAALGVDSSILARFPQAFLDGAAAPARVRATDAATADVADMALTQDWRLGRPGSSTHMIVSVHGRLGHERDYDDALARLARAWREPLPGEATDARDPGADDDEGVRLVGTFDARRPADGREHFGYADGIGQPRIAGLKYTTPRGTQPLASVGEFILGADHLDAYGGTSLGRLPATIGQNGTYCVMRLMAQDVEGFEAMLQDAAAASGASKEWIAAKLMGRWRNGMPLKASDGWREPPAHRSDGIDDFDFVEADGSDALKGDIDGDICPVASHVRRLNPRSSVVTGRRHSRRIIRRGMPYELIDDDGRVAERGLLGVFYVGDIERQFEFLLRHWAHGTTFTANVGVVDPILGRPGPKAPPYAFGGVGGTPPVEVPARPIVTTRGTVYLFMPGLRALRRLAAGEFAAPFVATQPAPAPVAAASTARPGEFDPDAIDVRGHGFCHDPYPAFALFRRWRPVHLIRPHQAYWVFSRELVDRVCAQPALFVKQPEVARQPRGLFFMDDPLHTPARQAVETMFAAAIADAGGWAQQEAHKAIAAIRKADRPFELVADYAMRVPREVFMRIMGIDAAHGAALDRLALLTLENFDATLPPDRQRLGGLSAAAMAQSLATLVASAAPGGLLARLFAARGVKPELQWLQTASNFMLGGYLSTAFALTTGVWHLLQKVPPTMPSAADAAAAFPPSRRWWDLLVAGEIQPHQAVAEALRFDAPFQLADRYAARDTELGGVRIPANAKVVVVYGSANHDVASFGPDAERFIPGRDAAAHVTFGLGPHHCIGAPLASVVLPVALGTLAEAFPALRLSSERPVWSRNPYFRTFDRLRLQHRPAR